jgi:sodium/proline symporter
MVLLGLCARVLFPDLADPELAFITATQELFPPVLAGLLLAAVLSAIMSTADSQLLVAASSVSHDLGLFAGDARGTVLRSRLVVAALSLGAIAAALWGNASIFDRVLFAWTAMGAAFGPILLVRVVSGPISAGARIAAMTVGFVTAVAAYLYPETRGTAWERVAPFVLAWVIGAFGRRRVQGRRDPPQ